MAGGCVRDELPGRRTASGAPESTCCPGTGGEGAPPGGRGRRLDHVTASPHARGGGRGGSGGSLLRTPREEEDGAAMGRPGEGWGTGKGHPRRRFALSQGAFLGEARAVHCVCPCPLKHLSSGHHRG